MSTSRKRPPHVLVNGRVASHGWKPAGAVVKHSVREVADPRSHGMRLLRDAKRAFRETDESLRSAVPEPLRGTGSIITLRSAPGFAIDLKSLSSTAEVLPWSVLTVQDRYTPDGEWFEEVTVWVADSARAGFLKRFERYATERTAKGSPRHKVLVANVSDVRRAFLDDLWTSAGEPPRVGDHWWMLLLDPASYDQAMVDKILSAYQVLAPGAAVSMGDVLVRTARTSWQVLEKVASTALPLTEVRRPQFLDDRVLDLRAPEADEYVEDLAGRVVPAGDDAPAVCHLDSGVTAGHALLRASIRDEDVYTIRDSFKDDLNHGTRMAGLALYGAHLEELLQGTGQVILDHRLESVKLLGARQSEDNPVDAATATIHAVAEPEVARPGRPRVFCMPVSLPSTEATAGSPTLWSAAVDALAAGTDTQPSDKHLSRIEGPDPDRSRLLIVSAGNVSEADLTAAGDFQTVCDGAPVEDPGQAWNALTVGAFTDLSPTSDDPARLGFRPLAECGDLSPYSRTSVTFPDIAPIKPEICLEGGNPVVTPSGDVEPDPALELTTTSSKSPTRLDSANATSAATAQAARLAALTMARYPELWPETVRGLLVHEARWTQPMAQQVDAAHNKTDRLKLLRRFGWGVPDEVDVLTSARHAVTMIIQDKIDPFTDGFKLTSCQVHSLPWPVETLQDLGAGEVRVRVTLSYFIEPSVRRRGWGNRYAYASHGLRFLMQAPHEADVNDFLHRASVVMNDDARSTGASDSDRWLVGPKGRSHGSLHQDEWSTTASEAAACNHIVVHPVGGWWKRNERKDRQDPVRYALIVSLTAADVETDLYTPIINEISAPAQVPVDVTVA